MRGRVHGEGGQGERERKRLKQAVRPPESQTRARSHDPKITTGAQINSRMLDVLSHPGAPRINCLKVYKSLAFRIFAVSCDHYLHAVLKHSHHP